nr:hypothetical protein [Ardenticatena sp.]
MSRPVKIALVILGMTFLICCLAFFGGYLFLKRQFDIVTDPTQARQMATDIIDYTLPAGYSEQMAFRVSNLFTYVLMLPENEDGMVFVLAAGSEGATLDPETARAAVEGQVGRRFDNMEQVDERPVTIRGEERTMLIFEGQEAQSGEMMRMAFVTFTGKKGPAFLLVMGPTNAWDDAALNEFIASMR